MGVCTHKRGVGVRCIALVTRPPVNHDTATSTPAPPFAKYSQISFNDTSNILRYAYGILVTHLATETTLKVVEYTHKLK